jgi:hypothetical protein
MLLNRHLGEMNRVVIDARNFTADQKKQLDEIKNINLREKASQ